jgi:bifunctional non-homologous end joining protein LigD
MKSSSTAIASGHLASHAIKVFTRRSRLNPPVQEDRRRRLAHRRRSAVIDGEVVAPADDGTTDFSVLQNELKGNSDRIVLVAFDLLYLNGRDLWRLPLHERKAALKKIVAETDVQFSESFEIDGPPVYAHVCKAGYEGVVSKVRDSTYASGRGNSWV